MSTILSFLAEQPLILLFLFLLIGSVLGSVKILGVPPGPAAVLFSAIAITAIGVTYDIKLAIPELVGTLGLVLFAYTVGVTAGPTFFSILPTAWRPVLIVAIGLGVVAGIGGALGAALGIPWATVAGTFAGALNNTPALAAASERSGDPGAAATGYSIAYIYGVVFMVALAAAILRRRKPGSNAASTLANVTIRVDRTDGPTIAEIVARHGHVVFSRVARSSTAPMAVAADDEVLHSHDLVTVVGTPDIVEAVTRDLGHRSTHNLNSNGSQLDSRRITLSQRKLAGRTLASLDLYGRFGGTVTRVRRGDLDIVAEEDFLLQLGDRLRVIVPSDQMRSVAAYLGDSERGMSDINPIGLALGITIGLLLGQLHVPLPGGGFTVGVAGGTLVTGLVFGKLGRVGPLVMGLPTAAATTLSSFGMLTFLAYAGTRSGAAFVGAVTSSIGWKVALLGAVITTLAGGVVILAGRLVGRMDSARLSGLLAGAHTQPAVLAFANERTGFDPKVGLGYALVYPVAMIMKILMAQVLAGM